MPGFFTHARGSVKKVKGPWQQPADFRTEMQGINLGGRAIITQVGLVQNGNFQFLHTINNKIFIYVFGDKISELRISGIAFGHECDSGQNGFDDIVEQYNKNRIAEKAEPITTTVGRTPFTGFLTGMSAQMSDPELLLTQWSFQMHVTSQET